MPAKVELISGSSYRYLVFNEDFNDKIKEFWTFAEKKFNNLMKEDSKITLGRFDGKIKG